MGRKKKYLTEEERKAAAKERNKRWKEENPDYFKRWYQENQREKMKRWYQENREEILDYQKRYYQENREKILDYRKRYYQENPEKIKEYQKQWREENPEKIKEYSKTPMGRAINLVSTYQQTDKKQNRGECTLTAQWVVDNIFTSKCNWCKETDWTKLGCDRIDNSLPHTPDNVVPCCEECNKKRGRKTYEEFMNTIRTDEIIL